MVSLFTMRWTLRFRNHEWIGNRDYKFMCWSSWHRAGAFNKKKSCEQILQIILGKAPDITHHQNWLSVFNFHQMVFDWILVWQNKSLILLLEIFQRFIRFGDFSSSSMYYPTVLFIYAPPMKYWVTIDLKIPTFSVDTNCKWWNKSER